MLDFSLRLQQPNVVGVLLHAYQKLYLGARVLI